MSLAADLYDGFSNRLARRNRRLAGVLVAVTGSAVVGWLLWKDWAFYDAAAA